MYQRILSRCMNWAKSHGSSSVEFEEEGDKVRVFLRTWDVDTFKRVCVATLDRYSSDPHQEISALGRMVDALGPDVSVASISAGSTILVEAFCENLVSGYRQKLIDYPVFDLRLFRRCLQRTASSVFGSLDGLAMTEFIVNRLKGAETRDWMSSRPALKKAILTNDLSLPHLVDVVANIIGVRLLIVSDLKETGRKDDGDSLVERSPSFWSCWCTFRTRTYCAVLCFRRRELTGTFTRTKCRECCILCLKSVSSPMNCCFFCFQGARSGSGKLVGHFPGTRWYCSTLVPYLLADGFLHHSRAWVGAISVALSMIHVSVSVASNFVHSSTAADQCYHTFGELARFVYCLLQKIRKASSLPLVEQWGEYMVPNHSRFPAIDDKNFLIGTPVMAALDKVGSHYLQK